MNCPLSSRQMESQKLELSTIKGAYHSSPAHFSILEASFISILSTCLALIPDFQPIHGQVYVKAVSLTIHFKNASGKYKSCLVK